MMAMITKNTIVTVKYTVTDVDGNLVDEGVEPLVYLHGGYGDIFAPIEGALEGKSVGDVVKVKLQPGEAFGEYDPDLVQIVPVDELPQPLTIGMLIEGPSEDEGGGDGDPVYLSVTDIADGKAVLDGNHPLAGMALIFTGSVAEFRPATADEIATRQGHA
jgi:FKBP-type peptidyl-prolyl cis-trans isomerase SlyD